MKVAIVGAGAIGLLAAYYLAGHKHDVTLLTQRKEQAEKINRHGLKLIDSYGATRLKPVKAQALADLTETDQLDVVILTVKSYSVKDVLFQLREKRIFAILFLQNGLSHIEYLADLPIATVAVGVMEHGAVRENDQTVRHTGRGRLRWGYVRKGAELLDELFVAGADKEAFPIDYEDDWLDILQQKLIVNACINPLTALLAVKNGELVKNEAAKEMMKAIFSEVMQVLEREDDEKRWAHVVRVCEQTAANTSSMLVDLSNRRRTEISSITGYLVRLAGQKQLAVPVLDFVNKAIIAKEDAARREGDD
ncbi:2-dehydropantoate 2-reductase [Alkalihalobacillus oceani]|uniref:2-dehydropantoate 2-reductase n=1 Tax=Halalkalibacter oceani TaxID=1653776 RepID=UPI0020414B17|nr:2-dehydropantoate 2-reductase [Halalkalibacter oceani]MCM3759338.1 2-dehydropantoate 2-reductase [Halalkalibacter oceani]